MPIFEIAERNREDETMQEEYNNQKKQLTLVAILYALALLAILLIASIGSLAGWFFSLVRIFRPIIIGLIISSMCNPIFRLFERKLFIRVRPQGARRALSLTCAYLTLLVIAGLLVLLIFPQLIQSISSFVQNYESYLSSTVAQVNDFLRMLNDLTAAYVNEPIFSPINGESLRQVLDNFFGTGDGGILALLKRIDLTQIFGAISQTFSVITDFILGLFVSIYLLSSKEKRSAQIMKFRRAMFGDKTNAFLSRLIDAFSRSFEGFLNGKLLDALLVGILTYIALSIFGIPYAILVSTIIGIANIIPVVGPFVGAIPSAVIIFTTRPDKVLVFILIIVIIQQIDGNVISPKILGDNTKVSPLSVIIAVSVMGSLWGFAGMILGVPLFATVLEILELSVIDRLQRKGLPSGLGNYYASDSMFNQASEPTNKKTNPIEARLEKKYLHAKSLLERDPDAHIGFGLECSCMLYRLGLRLHLFTEPNEDALAFSAVQEALSLARKAGDARMDWELDGTRADAKDTADTDPNE